MLLTKTETPSEGGVNVMNLKGLIIYSFKNHEEKLLENTLVFNAKLFQNIKDVTTFWITQ